MTKKRVWRKKYYSFTEMLTSWYNRRLEAKRGLNNSKWNSRARTWKHILQQQCFELTFLSLLKWSSTSLCSHKSSIRDSTLLGSSINKYPSYLFQISLKGESKVPQMTWITFALQQTNLICLDWMLGAVFLFVSSFYPLFKFNEKNVENFGKRIKL